jgi:FAD/FMN-containing dehydrogenase
LLADGSFVVASAEENADLFWAVGGGGGNFGVVTSFLFEAHPVSTVCAGPMLWNLEDAADVMTGNGKKITDWARGYYNALHPFGAGALI